MTTPTAGQIWSPTDYTTNADFVAELGAPLIDLLGDLRGKRVLDLGCGDGALTLKLKEGGADVTGVDASPEMIDAARGRGLQAMVVDGRRLGEAGLVPGFDHVFTNAAMHWMDDHPAVVSGVARLVKPGGKFVGELGGLGNVASISLALGQALNRRGIDARPIYPWNFACPKAFAKQLEAAGFRVDTIIHFPRPTPLPTDMVGWLRTFAGAFLNALPEQDHTMFLQETADLLAPHWKDSEGRWTADYVRLRFSATKLR